MFEIRGFVSFFLNSDKEVSIACFSCFQVGILEWLTGFIISKGILESSICFWILKPIDLIHFLKVLSYKCSYCGLKTQSKAGSLSLRKSIGSSFATTYKLSTGDVRKAPRQIASSDFKYDVLTDPHTIQP